MQWLLNHVDLVLMISYGILSEILAIIQLLKYPTNEGVGGVVAGLLKFVKSFMKKDPEAPAVTP